MKSKNRIVTGLLCTSFLAGSAFGQGALPPGTAPTEPPPAPSPSLAPAAFAKPALAGQPIIDLPVEPAGQPSTGLPRETPIENSLGRVPAMSGSAFGGYGELTFNKVEGTPAIVDLRRLVVFFGHNFTDSLRFYSEVEVEHAVSSQSDAGEVEIEQAYIDSLFGRRLNLRAGLILVPVGIVNIYHEPPTFNGVDRPEVDVAIIPSTWREPGFGIFGELTEGLRYQLYLVNGFNANGFTAAQAIRDGHQEAQLARAGDFGGVVRLDLEPRLGTDIGVSGYFATAGNTLRGTVGKVPVSILEIDARTQIGGFTARAELAALFIGDAAALNAALGAAGNSDGPVSGQSRGGYVEGGYDLLRFLDVRTDKTLTLFGRYDYVNTQAAVPTGFTARPELRRQAITCGLVFRPIPPIAVKLDYRRHFFGAGPATNEVASALTWMF